jgi:anti-anti-sigma factor
MPHVRVLGPLNRETAPLLQRRLEAAAPEAACLCLDLGAADYLDSDGIRWLQRLQTDLHARGLTLRLAIREGSRVERTLTLLQLTGAFEIDRYAADADQAPAAFPV